MRVDGRSGVWLPATAERLERKICAIGVRVARGVTMHGFAFNCNPSLERFDRIVPCGISDADVTSLSREVGREVTVTEVVPTARGFLEDALAPVRWEAQAPTPATHPVVPDPHKEPRVTIAPEGRRMLRIEARNAETPIERKPEWIRTKATMGPEYTELKTLVKGGGLHTVCEEAGCPNIFECWEDREATFLIGGAQCTRRCDFCQIDTGKPTALDRMEPLKVAKSVQQMGLKYSTVTGVARDDLDDGGAWLYAETVRQIHEAQPRHGCRTPDPRLQRRPRSGSPRSSPRGPRCWPTTSRPCRASSSASAPPSATSGRSR
ncbi:hypothetical protein GCM10025876_02450 [Demequina litorisediminis]|uniref:BPL/LPL catalytic domain-containing protein n=1 Tax=Demequina litorisediminis TaxID=1849022 RepID=A0ABQ6I9B7_9MICO|nr:hypothetical protein GCM10025876_02450 [Demequina litorisediminis]